MIAFLNKIAEEGILLEMSDDRKLKLFAENSEVDQALLAEIKSKKEEIIQYFMEEANAFNSNTNAPAIPKVAEREFYATSSAQKRMYFLYDLDRNSLAYNMPQMRRFQQGLDTFRLSLAFEKLIQRHEILRTTFHMPDVDLVQKVNRNFNFEMETYTLKEHSLETMFTNFVRPFDLQNGPLIRAATITKSTTEQYLLVDFHHIISDGISHDVMLEELMKLYAGEVFTLPRLQYKDYAEWLQTDTQQEVIAKQVKFWQNEFEEELTALALPTDKPRPIAKSFAGDTVELVLNENTAQELRSLARESETTMLVVLLSLFYVLLNQLTAQEDIVVGTPVAGRQHPDTEKMIGLFVNTLAIRNKVDSSDEFVQFLGKMKSKVLACLDNQSVPFEELLDELNVERNTNRNPLFDVMFSHENFMEATTTDLSLNELDDAKIQSSKFDLSLTVVETKAQVLLIFEYSTDLFRKETIERFAVYFENIVTQVTSNPNVLLSAIDVLPKSERQNLLNGFNQTQVDFPKDKTVITLFQEQVKKAPAQTALVFEGKRISYSALDQYSNQLANYLLANYDFNKEDLINVVLEKSEWLVISLLAVLKTGCAYVPIDLAYPEERVNYIKNDSQAKVIIDKAFLEQFIAFDNKSNLPPNVNLSTDSLAYVIYTSGSTGQPKGVMIEHKSLVNLCFWHQKQYDLSSNSRGTLFSGIAFDASVWEIYPYLISGAALYPIASKELRLNVENLAAFLLDKGITHAYLPTQVCQEMHNQNLDLGPLKILTGGDVLHLTNETKLNIYNNYGPTENTVVTTMFDLKEAYEYNIPIGKPIHNTQAYILSEDLKLQPQGVVGELCVSGTGLARAYLNRPELTKEKFVPHPFAEGQRMYRTGDLAKWLPDGNLEFIGRKDGQVKIRGFRIELSEIEYHLLQYEALKEVVVCAMEHQSDKYLVAYYTAEEEIAADLLNAIIGKTLPVYMLPSYYVKLDRIPLNANGKINRKALPVPTITMTVDYEAPANETEEKLVVIWSEILNLKPEVISVNKRFFELGGHSLKALAMINQIHKVFEVKIPVAEIFKHQDIRSLGQHIGTYESNVFTTIPQVATQAHYPLSSAQQRMYFLYSLNENSMAYNMPQAYGFKGDLNYEKLERAFNQLLARHDIFRTTFSMHGHEPVQKIASHLELEMEYYPLSTSRQGKIWDQFVRPFNLEQGPLIRAAIVESAEDTQYLLLDMHHIISDGLSFNILYRELIALYQGATLPDLDIQYKDYAVWQQSEEQESIIAKHKTFWLNEFTSAPEVLDLPIDFIRPAVKTFAGDSVVFEISEKETNGLKKIVEESGATMYLLLLSAFNVLLHKLSNQDEITIGTPTAGRHHDDLKNMIGLFVNTLAIKNEVIAEESFDRFLEGVKTKVLACFENELFQYEELVDHLQIQRDSSRNPLYDVLFSFENFLEMENADSLESSMDLEESILAKFDLSLNATTVGNRLQFDFNYATDLFKKETIERFVRYFKKIIKAIVADSTITISKIDILPAEERQQVLIDFNQSQWVYPKDQSLTQLFEAQAEASPKRVALVYQEQQLTYKELNAQANQLARLLIDQGVIENSVVGIMVDRSPEMIVSILAVLKAKATYLPIDKTQPQNRIEYLLQESEMALLLTDQEQLEIYSNKVNAIDVFKAQEVEYSSENLSVKPSIQSPAYIIFTSGSTGKPKGVIINHQSVVNYISYQKDFFGINQADRILQFSPYYFDASVEQIWMALTSGAALVLIDKATMSSEDLFNDYLSANKVTHLHATPSFLETINLREEHTLKRIVAGGEVCKATLSERYGQTIKFYNEYGPTETTISAIECEVDASTIVNGKVMLGKPVGNTSIYILDKDLNPRAIGVAGEMYIAGDCLSIGYLNQAELTRARFIDNPFAPGEKMYKSGDLARWMPDGNIDFLERIDHQVKIRGYRIELGEIENHLSSFEGISECVVTVFEKEEDKYLTAYYVAEKEINRETLQRHLQANLPDYMLPSYFMNLTAMPKTPSGKLDRKSLPSPMIAQSDDYEAPANETEEKLVAIWADVLGLEAGKISTTKSFFELGGHSLKAIKMVSMIKESLQKEIPLVEVFNKPKIRALANYFNQEKRTVAYSNEIITLLKRGENTDKNLFFIHDGSGDVQGYLDLVNTIGDYHCWGLRSSTFGSLAPQQVDIPALANHYIEEIHKIQNTGPYQLIGWSMGGVLAYEVARQLEERGEAVAEIIMIDTHFYQQPVVPENETNTGFSLESEHSLMTLFFAQYLPLEVYTSLSEFWENIIQHAEQNGIDLESIRAKIPDDIRDLIPNFEKLDIRNLLQSINTIRSLRTAVDRYTPTEKLEANLLYFKAQESDYDTRILLNYFKNKSNIITIEGDHFSILQKPQLEVLIEKINL